MPELKLDYSYIPTDYCVEGMKNYFEHHIKPGDFLTALLENDFLKALRYADPVNMSRLGDWAQWLTNEPGMMTYGSKEAVARWIAMRTYGSNNEDRQPDGHVSDPDGSGDV